MNYSLSTHLSLSVSSSILDSGCEVYSAMMRFRLACAGTSKNGGQHQHGCQRKRLPEYILLLLFPGATDKHVHTHAGSCPSSG